MCLRTRSVPHRMAAAGVPVIPGQPFRAAACTLLLLVFCLILLCRPTELVFTMVCARVHASPGSFSAH